MLLETSSPRDMLHEDGSPPGWRQRARLARCACAEHTGVSGVAQGKVAGYLLLGGAALQ